MKCCTKCKQSKNLLQFSKHYGICKPKDGLQSWCKMCAREAKIKFKAANKISCRFYNQQWWSNNKAKGAEYSAKRRAKQNKATPSWLTFEQKQKISDIYEEAQELSWLSEDGLQVDHIIPLNGKDVCGLHVPWNLQLLPASLNMAKGNR